MLFSDGGSLQDPPKKVLPVVKLPPASKPNSVKRQSKSTSDLTQVPIPPPPPPDLRKSTPEISQDPRGTKVQSAGAGKLSQKNIQKQQNEQLKLDKKRLEEQKKRAKLAAQEQAKQEKLRKEREKAEAQQRAKEAKRIEKENKAKNKATGKVKADTPLRANPLAKGSQAQNPRDKPQAQGPSQAPGPQYSTNTLESSISRTSGPPPYAAQDSAPKTTKAAPTVVLNERDNTGNTSFAQPAVASGSSWDMIAQHREQINRKTFAPEARPKQRVLDLQFNAASSTSDDKGSEV